MLLEVDERADLFPGESRSRVSRQNSSGTCLIYQLAVPDRRGVKRLEGNFSSMRIQKNPDSVGITDEKALPVAWKDVVLTMPAHVREALLERLEKDERRVFEE